MEPQRSQQPTVVVSFDVEEHHLIESAAGLSIDPHLVAEYTRRMECTVDRLLAELAEHHAKATFFILGTIARARPKMVRAIADQGHEIASHGWNHARVGTMTPEEFRCDIRQAKHALEDAVDQEVVGYRAPTFSILRKTAWAIDILAEEGFRYDSSIFPVRHDRYGVPDAPRRPFRVRGLERELVELPPATLRLPGMNLPVGGGGYFRLFPLPILKLAVRRLHRLSDTSAAMLYFHPWEFDPQQPRLPLRGLNRFRTYVGIHRSWERLRKLLQSYRFVRTIDLVDAWCRDSVDLPSFGLIDTTKLPYAATDSVFGADRAEPNAVRRRG